MVALIRGTKFGKHRQKNAIGIFGGPNGVHELRPHLILHLKSGVISQFPGRKNRNHLNH